MNSNNMRFILVVLLTTFMYSSCWSQTKLDKTLKTLNKETVPYILAEELSADTVILLDTRKIEEYNVSHLQNAVWVGHSEFDENTILTKFPNKQDSIVVYCSIGVRSENIGERLMALGYRNVQNLYGGIFEWKNKNKTVFNLKNQETDSVHTFNKHWGKLLHKGEKVY